MDQSDLGGSKKNKGIYSQQLINLKRKQQVESILSNGSADDENLVKYRDKLLCKLCNTLHVNIISYQRHIRGKKHATKVKLRERKLSKQSSKNETNDPSQTATFSSQSDIERDTFIKQYTNALLQKHNVKSKNTKFYNIGSVFSQENIFTQFTIDNSRDDDEDRIGFLIKLKLDADKNESRFLYKRYLSKEEMNSNNIVVTNDLLLIHLPDYKPIIVKIPDRMSLIGGEDGMRDCKIDDCWYLQLSLLIRE